MVAQNEYFTGIGNDLVVLAATLKQTVEVAKEQKQSGEEKKISDKQDDSPKKEN